MYEDIFLSTDRGNKALRFQGTRFFHDELRERNEDEIGNLRPPNINRFPCTVVKPMLHRLLFGKN